MDEYYTVDEFGKLLKVSRATVYNWMEYERLRYVRAGKFRRISRDDLQAFLKREQNNEDVETDEIIVNPALVAALETTTRNRVAI